MFPHASFIIDGSRTKLLILHIEDDEAIATVAREILEEQGWQVNTCDNGNGAIEHI